MTRYQTAVVEGVQSDALAGTLGDLRSRGWEIRQLIPTAWLDQPSGGVRVSHVTHWTVVVESTRPLPEGVETRQITQAG